MKKILLIEDDQSSALALSLLLQTEGYKVTLAVDAVTATSKAMKEEPDLIIADIGLPGGNGLELIERMKKMVPLLPVPVIVVSARDESQYRKKALDCGAVDFFQKPADTHRLLEAIRENLRC